MDQDLSAVRVPRRAAQMTFGNGVFGWRGGAISRSKPRGGKQKSWVQRSSGTAVQRRTARELTNVLTALAEKAES